MTEKAQNRSAASETKFASFSARYVNGSVLVHRAAFPTFFLSFLGGRFLREFYSAFGADHSALALVALGAEGEVIGVIVGTSSPTTFFRRVLRRRWFAFAIACIGAILRRPTIVPRLIRAVNYRGQAPSGSERALLSSIAVDPGKQRNGVGRALVTRWLELARARGLAGCFLVTDSENNNAVNEFYQRFGWKLEYSYRTPEGRRMNRYIYDFKAEASS